MMMNWSPSGSRAARLFGISWVALGAALSGVGCESAPAPKPRRTEPIVRDIPTVFHNTIGSAASFNGVEPIIVYGYGLVVGLNGTGGGILDDALAGRMEREISLRRLGPSLRIEHGPLANRSAKDLLRDKNIAVVLVQAAVPPAAPDGLTFDVYVRALNATSLEGGMLWTSDLHIQQGAAGTIGGAEGKRLAIARGPVFINPFADPAGDSDGVTRRTGRVLDGGMMVEPLKVEVLLDEESHTRARRIVESVNTRFPEEPGQRERTARGRNGQSIALTVPPSFTYKPAEFIKLVQHLQIETTSPDAFAKRYTDAMKDQPWLARELSYCLEAIGGDSAIRFARELYDAPDASPRLSALRAGASLGDHRAADFLIEMAERGLGAERLDAITLLAGIDAGPKVDLALRKLLESRELLVRVAAYESLAKRALAISARRAIAHLATNVKGQASDGPDYVTHRQVLLRGAIPGNNLQGVRRDILDDKYQLDTVPGGDPMIYMSQQSQPKIVLFGGEMKLTKPCLVSAWEDRLIITADAETPRHRVYYRDYRTGKTYKQDVSDDLGDLIRFLTHKPTPEDPSPGLDMSYSEVVGALYAIHQQRGVICAFATEADKLQAQLLEAARAPTARVRPETAADREEMSLIEQPDTSAGASPARPAEPRRPRIIPITRPPESKGK